MRFKRCRALTAAIVMALSLVPGNICPVQTEAADSMKFDLGANAQSGWTGVSAAQGYDKNKGYGFSSAKDVKNVAASGQGALSDAVQFTGNTTFNVDLKKGLYKVKVTLGNTSRTSVYMEDMIQIVNMTGNNAVDEVLIPVTDGQLNIRAGAGKSGTTFSISALEIEKVSDDPALPPTIWICGDSTVCNYYPLNTSVQGGWGQMLGHYVDKGWNIRNMAASGQYAQGFVDAGQFKPIETYGKKGDVYIISIGINDSKYYKGDVYQKVVTDMVQKAKKKGMDVILVKQQGRNGDAQKNPLLKSRWFAGELDNVAKAENCQIVDLFNLWQNYCISIGANKTTALYMNGDTLHPNRAGAEKLAELFAGQFKQNPSVTQPVVYDTDIEDGTVYTFKNVNSGKYLSAAEGARDSANITQRADDSAGTRFKAVSAGNGYFYLVSELDGEKYALDVHARKTDNGTNVELYTFNKGENQQFRIVKNSDGTYSILTRVTGEASCVEVENADTADGANVQQWELNGHNCQKWYAEKAGAYTGPDVQPPEPTSDSFLYGDLDGDGRVDGFDMTLMRRELINSELDRSTKRRADVDANGKVSIADAVQLQTFLLSGKNFSAVEERKMFAYAIDQTISEGTEESTNEGFRDTAYVNLDNKVGSNIQWKISAPTDGNYLCTFGTANGSADNRKMKIEVSGQTDYWVQDFLTTGGWTAWEERGIVLPLKKGENTIKMTSETAQGGPNLDYMQIEWTDEPIAQAYEEKPDVPAPEQSNVSRTIYIAGDSTVQTYGAKYAPQQGWGAYLGENMPAGVSVSNHAIAGRSSKSFYDNGRLDTILGTIRKNDYLLIQFGINDAASNKAERYAPTCGKVPGTAGSFEDYMAKYIEGAKSKGAVPILVTTVIGLKAYNSGTKKFAGSYTNYCNAMKQLASYYNIPCIDLNSLMVAHYNSIGYDAAYKYHMCSTGSTDMTHFTEAGARAVAKLVADEMKKQGLC
ncbi:MAG: RICIN domain-containing protein [Ruminococcus sp.]|nr:RICIN domain-containing protein [Ruminococcus sp.]